MVPPAYLIPTQIWINNKWDWPGKNWSMWKTKDKDETNEYADGRWRLCVYDLDFGGISGKSSASDNTIKEDNYKDLGLLDMDTENPVVLSFAYLMTNNGFRTDFEKYLKEIDGTVFEKNNAVTLCEKYQGIYEPLYRQFFARYFGSSKAEKYKKEAKSGGYGSYKCIVAFIKERSKYIDNMITWVNEQYSDDTDEETVTGRTFSKFNVVAKKGSKNIKISTGTNKTNVKITGELNTILIPFLVFFTFSVLSFPFFYFIYNKRPLKHCNTISQGSIHNRGSRNRTRLWSFGDSYSTDELHP